MATMLKPTREVVIKDGRTWLKRVPGMPNTWKNVRVHWIASGQAGPYKDSVYTADLLLEGSSQSSFDDLDSPFFFRIDRETVKLLVAALVHPFVEQGARSAYSSYLASLEIVDEGPAHRVWRATVVSPYTD